MIGTTLASLDAASTGAAYAARPAAGDPTAAQPNRPRGAHRKAHGREVSWWVTQPALRSRAVCWWRLVTERPRRAHRKRMGNGL
jgi:hypothetical protein